MKRLFILYIVFILTSGWGLGLCYAKIHPESMPFDTKSTWGVIGIIGTAVILSTFAIISHYKDKKS